MIPTTTEIIETTKEVLSQPEFQAADPEATAGFLNRLLARLLMNLPPRTWEAFFYIMITFGILYFIWQKSPAIRQWFMRSKQPEAQPVIAKTEAISPKEKTLEAVRKLISDNNLVLAIKQIHCVLLQRLENRKVITRKKWKTNSCYVLECLKASEKWGIILRDLSHDFDWVVFGKGVLSPERLEEHLSRIEEQERQ